MAKLLTGAIDICKRIGCTESTFMNHIIHDDLPVVRNDEGQWQEKKPGAIDSWLGAKEAKQKKVDEEKKVESLKGKQSKKQTSKTKKKD